MITLLMIGCWMSPWSGRSARWGGIFATRPATGASGIKIGHTWPGEQAQVTVSNTYPGPSRGEPPVESEPRPVLPQLRLDELLAELQTRLQAVLATRDRVHALLEAVVAVGGNLDLEIVLRKIIEAAVALVQARYGALGVIGDDGRLSEFIPIGLDEAEIAAIEHWPEGH